MAEGGNDGSDQRKKMNYAEFKRIEEKIAVRLKKKTNNVCLLTA